MVARQVAHEHRGHVLGVVTLAGVVHPRSDRPVLERTVLHTEPSGVEAAGHARPAILERPRAGAGRRRRSASQPSENRCPVQLDPRAGGVLC
ncbi:hypothetical protein [Curtobacterium citreum]|uniref:hypothetical protein n=1 Tax=Curtobacterium citreum TaxID=2036 RepID=UPI003570E8FC